MTAALRTVDLDVRFGEFVAVDSASLSCSGGTVHAIIGPNGAGKTTFVNAVTGLVPAHSGEILLQGVSVQGRRPVDLARAGVSRTFQHPEVFDSLTPEQHLRACRPSSQARVEVMALGHDLVRQLPPKQALALDFYQRRLLELARALAMGPAVLFLDEPVSGLDEDEREEMAKLLASAAGLGVAVILIEHDMRVVHRLADEVTVLDNGAVVATGAASVIAADPEVARAYMGES